MRNLCCMIVWDDAELPAPSQGTRQKKKQRRFNSGFKQEAVKLVTEQGLSIKQAAGDLGISPATLARWKREVGYCEALAVSGENNSRDAGIEQLRRELKLVSREREILKEAVGIFSRR